MRVGVPAIVGETCVSCHNAHPDSPRRDWKVGDVRGVQQITLPLPDVGASFIPDLREPAIYVGIFTLVGIVLIRLLLRELQLRIEQTRDLARATEIKNVELAAATAEADLANTAQGELIANVGHELRTPLNSIIGFSEILMDERLGPLGTAPYRDFADEIHAGGEQLLVIVNSILYMSQLESGRAEMRQEPVSLETVLQDSIAIHESAATEKMLAVSGDC